MVFEYPHSRAAVAVAVGAQRDEEERRSRRSISRGRWPVAAIAISLRAILGRPTSPSRCSNYIGIYTLGQRSASVPLTGVGGLTSFPPSGIRRHRRLRDRLARRPRRRFALARPRLRTDFLPVWWRAARAVTLRLMDTTCRWHHRLGFGDLLSTRRYRGIGEATTAIQRRTTISIGSLSFASNSPILFDLVRSRFGDDRRRQPVRWREGRAIRRLAGRRRDGRSFGINLFRWLVTFVIAALLAGLSGRLYAHMSRYVGPAPSTCE